MGQFFHVITLDQHVIHRRTRVINLKSQLSRSLVPTTYHPQEGNYSFPQKLSSVEFPVTLYMGWLYKLNLHPRHQHCTDEAQKAETVLSAVRYSSLALQSFCFHVQIEHSTGMSHCR